MGSFDTLGYELGWEHARHAVAPDSSLLDQHLDMQAGWEAGRQRFDGRTRSASPWARRWLRLRTEAWLRGLSFDDLGVTPHYLRQISASHCPVTRQALPEGSADAVIGRVCDEAAYAIGNLATLDRTADAAKAGRDWREALDSARLLTDHLRLEGLDRAEWQRLGVLLSFVTALPHDEAARLPLAMMPPNRLHLLNPIQGLQVALTRLLTLPGWSRRLWHIQGLLTTQAQRDDLQRFFMALLPAAQAAAAMPDATAQRWALEDAWQRDDVLALWSRFALGLTAAESQRLLEDVASIRLGTQRMVTCSDEQATEGWSLDTRGYVQIGRQTDFPARPAGPAH